MSQERVLEVWVSLRSLPPKEEIVAVVLNDILGCVVVFLGGLMGRGFW